MNPKEAVIAITYRCNCRCKMCNIWKESAFKEIPPEEYRKLPESLKVVNITGGEPFLHPDLKDVMRVLHERLPRARFVFSTNGLMTDRICRDVDEFRRYHSKIGVGVSIDGIGTVHDDVRGLKGLYQAALSTVKSLKQQGVTDLRIAMTIMPNNLTEIGKVYELSRELGVEFTATFAHDSDVYFRKTDNLRLGFETGTVETVSDVVRSQVKSKSPKDWFRAFHTQGIVDRNLRQSFFGECRAGDRHFFLDPSGDVFPCNILNLKMGNITQVAGWDDLVTRDDEIQTSRKVSDCRLDCWMVCNTRSLMISHPVRIGGWILKNKIGTHLHKASR